MSDTKNSISIYSKKLNLKIISSFVFGGLIILAGLILGFNALNPESQNAKAQNTSSLQLESYGDFNCLLNEGKVKCWGEETVGQLGYGATTNFSFFKYVNDLSKVGFVDFREEVAAISVGQKHGCALLELGDVSCWGNNNKGQLGYGNTYNIGDSEVPGSVSPVALGQKATKVTAGGSHSCALLASGNIKCWGDNTKGQLGYGNTDNIGDDESLSSATTVNIGESVKKITLAGDNTCVLLVSNNLKCWVIMKSL